MFYQGFKNPTKIIPLHIRVALLLRPKLYCYGSKFDGNQFRLMYKTLFDRVYILSEEEM